MKLRTTARLIRHAAKATPNKPYGGVKGASALNSFTYKYMESCSIDIMHCLYEGLTKKLMGLWFSEKRTKHNFSLYKFIDLVNEKISLLKPPDFVQRILRSVAEYKYWKASEFKIFLLYYSLPILKDIMEPVYFNHHVLLVYAITILNSPSISEDMIKEANRLLKEYVRRFKVLYGEKYQVYNLHLLLHLPSQISLFGPLFLTSCFCFENANGILKSFVHGTKFAELEIDSSISTYMCLPELKKKYLNQNSEISKYCKKTAKSGYQRRKLTKLFKNDTFAVGAYKLMTEMPAELQNLLNENNIYDDINKCHEFKKLLQTSIYYETKEVAVKKKKNSSIIKYIRNGYKYYGTILKFITICNCECLDRCNHCIESCETYAIINQFDEEPVFNCTLLNSCVKIIIS